MASRKGINPRHFTTIFKRQQHDLWGPDYQPSIRATAQEAPSISRASILTPALLEREVHVLSLPERHAGLLALYSPWLKGMQEQKVMFPVPRTHPLYGYPGIVSPDLPAFKGLIDVAERLGCLHLLPRISVVDPSCDGAVRKVIYPYLGDFLLCLQPPGEPQPYCINWSVKDTEVAFKRPAPTSYKRKTKGAAEATEAILLRHQIEELYFADAEISTHRLAGEQIDFHVAANLEQLFGYHRRKLSIPATLQQDILEKFRAAMGSGIPPLDVALMICAQGKAKCHDCRTVLYRAIWQRELRVDLFRAVLFDRPLHPEIKDVLDVYSDWFRR